jgi:menaquinone C8-methyltransferase
MLVENFLKFYASRLTQRYLSFDKYSASELSVSAWDSPYLLYIHIPFCQELCPYCSFVRVKFDRSLAESYFDALKKEIEMYHGLGYCFDSIYVGGGTPTIMPDRLVQIIDYVKSNWPIKKISIETNPNHLTDDITKILKNSGVNRLSVGVQSFDNGILEKIERIKKYGNCDEITERLVSVVGKFDTVNVDMIFNFPNQTDAMLLRDMEILKKINPDQVTYYPLMASTGQQEELLKRFGEIKASREKQLYEILTNGLAETYNQDSVWCFSNKADMIIDEYIVDHDDYVGLGPGSWSYIKGKMYSNTFSIAEYITKLNQGEHPVVGYRNYNILERMRYDLLLKLLDGNLALSHMKKKFGREFWLWLSCDFLFLLANGAIVFRDGSIVLTPKGRYCWVILMRTLFSIVGDYRDKHIPSDPPQLVLNGSVKSF